SIQSNNIKLKQASSLYESANVDATLLKDIDSHFDLYIICVKQTHLKDTLSYIEKFSDTQPLLFLQNGMGHIETIQTYNKTKNIKYSDTKPLLFLQNSMGHIETIQTYNQPVYIGVVSHGAHRSRDNVVSHLGNGMIKIASLTGKSDELNSLAQRLNQETFPIELHNDWESLLKQKLMINAVINPITALFDVPNGKILTNKHLHYLAKELCKETATVLQLSETDSWDEIVYVAEQTKENVSSMRADIQ